MLMIKLIDGPINLGEHGLACPNYPKEQVCKIFVIPQKRSDWWSWIFVQMSIKVFLNWCYCFWWAWPGMPKVLQITSMQNLFNISINELCYVLHADKKESLSQVDSIFLMGLTRHAQSFQVSLQCLCDI